MYTGRTLVTALFFLLVFWGFCNPVSAQSFEDRWSVVPEANAQESVQPNLRAPKPGQARRSEQIGTTRGARWEGLVRLLPRR
jgi:hypothetical protein